MCATGACCSCDLATVTARCADEFRITDFTLLRDATEEGLAATMKQRYLKGHFPRSSPSACQHAIIEAARIVAADGAFTLDGWFVDERSKST